MQTEIVTLALIAANILISYKGFRDASFFDRNLFEVGRVLHHREYGRLFMSGFLHVDWTHLLFNMFSLYSFSAIMEQILGPVNVLIIYFASLFGGDLLALFIHRRHPGYRAVGASGAVSGVIFAAIAIVPDIHVSLFLIPIGIPGWLFGICYVIYSMYGIRTSAGNIGHEAHLGGALVGLVTAVLIVPAVLKHNTLPVALIGVAGTVFLLLMVFRPDLLGKR
ncbi:MAG TPA: rhomboid family intramembrane serine protease [Cyclobacteriaceae bacterium]|nr:rhomboid family intramembrane serine protease [Cyclobacteriaceae bacterium]